MKKDRLKIDIVYTDKGTFYNIVLSRYDKILKASMDRYAFQTTFNVSLPDVYDYSHMDAIKRAIEAEWKGMVEISHSDAMDVS